MKVLSAPGCQCPREDDPTSYIPDTGDPVEVPDTMYYRRLVNEGSLVLSSSIGLNRSNGSSGLNSKKTKEVTTDGK